MNMNYVICTSHLCRYCHYLILAHTLGYFYSLPIQFKVFVNTVLLKFFYLRGSKRQASEIKVVIT